MPFKYRYTLLLLFSVLWVSMMASAKDNFTVVIDAGHGGKDAGACEGNHREKDINLGVALKLGEKIRKDLKGVDVVYTRSGDNFISLQGRADKANKAKGNLFISIHTNSLDKNNKNRTTAAGSSVYVLGLHKDKNNMAVAQRENSVIKLEKGYEHNYGFDPNSDESYIIFEMTQKKNLSQSIKFADEVQRQLVKTAGRRDRGVHQAGFWVLWATSMPAVLVELDFICNNNSAVFMTSEKGQTLLAESIFNAVRNYYSGISGKKSSKSSGKERNGNRTEQVEKGEVVLASVGSSRVHERFVTEKPSLSRRNTLAKRRRRSLSSKELSDNRVLEATGLNVGNRDDKTQAVVADRQEDTSEVKEFASDNKRSALLKADKATKKKQGRSHRAKKDSYRTLYAIKLFETDRELKQGNERFCGLKPVKVIKENNKFKYFYGESENRSTVEKMLKNVREKIPEAEIIRNIRRVV